MRTHLAPLAAVAVALLPGAAHAQTTVDFAANACTGSIYEVNYYATPFETQGFRFTSSASDGRFATPCTDGRFYAGKSALENDRTGATTTLTQISGNPFSISSIDLAQLYGPQQQPTAVTFTGTQVGGLTVTQVDLLTPALTTPTFTTYSFLPVFTNLVSLQFSAQTYPPYQFTNLVVTDLGSAGGMTATPEPGALALLGAGLIGVGLAVRRRATNG